jgi:hypothetical protein
MNGINDLFVSGALNQTFRPKLKKVSIFGKELALENWIKFVAQDCTGDVFGFESQPKHVNGFWYAPRGQSATLYQAEQNEPNVQNPEKQLIKL